MSENKMAIEDWIEQHWKDSKCQICKEDSWLVQQNIANLQCSPTDCYALIVIICQCCGHTLFVNAVAAGLIEDPDTEIDKALEDLLGEAAVTEEDDLQQPIDLD